MFVCGLQYAKSSTDEKDGQKEKEDKVEKSRAKLPYGVQINADYSVDFKTGGCGELCDVDE